MFPVLGVCSFSEKCVFCNTQGFNRICIYIYITSVQIKQMARSMHTNIMTSVKKCFLPNQTETCNLLSQNKPKSTTTLPAWCCTLMSSAANVLLFIIFFRENQINWFFRIIQQNPSPFVHPTWTDFSPTALCTKKTNKSKRVAHETTRLLNIEYCNRGVVLHVVKDFGGKVREITKKSAFFPGFFEQCQGF